MQSKKFGPVAATAVIALSTLLAGCGSGDTSSNKDGITTITWWGWNPDQQTSATFVDAFEEAHPDIKVKYRYLPENYANTVLLALRSGSGPDVFGVAPDASLERQAVFAEDLTPLISQALGSDWNDQLAGDEQLAVDGSQVGSPVMLTAAGTMWVNMGKLDELGLAVPTTADELFSFCEEVANNDKTCISQGAKDAWHNEDVFQILANQIERGAFWDAIEGNRSFDDAVFVQAFDAWKTLFDRRVFQDDALGATAYPDAADAFYKQQAAIVVLGTWANPYTTHKGLEGLAEAYGDQAANEELVPYGFPAMTPNDNTDYLFGGPDVGLAVSKTSKAREAAEEFVAWMTLADDGGQKIMAGMGNRPALLSVPSDLADVVTDRQREALAAQEDMFADLVSPRSILDPDVNSALGDALSAVAAGQQSPEEAAASVQSAIEGSS